MYMSSIYVCNILKSVLTYLNEKAVRHLKMPTHSSP